MVMALPAAKARADAIPISIPSRNIQLLSQWNQYPPGPNYPFGAGYSACWSYIHSDGREYALLGTTNGLAIYNVTDPVNSYPVGFVNGPYSAWREMKSYRNWIYVVTESPNAPNPGLQIIRMTDPEHPQLVGTYLTNFQTSHTVSVDTSRAILICNGTRTWSGQSGYAMGMRILSIANPEAPVEIGWWPGGTTPTSVASYVHDCVPIGNRLYASSVYIGTERIFDFSNPATPIELTSFTYPRAYYTHNSWPDKTGNLLYITDEQNGQTLRVADISNLPSPVIRNEYSPNIQSIVHNACVKGDELYIASYTEGIRVLDIADPAHPAEFGFADSYPGTSGGYEGVWGICPYFPSGTFIASDMQSGLYVYRPTRNYGILKVAVIDGATSTPAAGVTVLLSTQGDSLTTPADGIVRFAASPGPQTVEVRRFGYVDVSATRNVVTGVSDSVTLVLDKQPTTHLSGVVRDATTLAPLAEADVTLSYTPATQRTNGSGQYAFNNLPDDFYQIEVRRPGYLPVVTETRVGPEPNQVESFPLRAATTWDDLETDHGWTVGALGDNATAGTWTRVTPLGTEPPATVQPSLDGIDLGGTCRGCGMACGGGGCACGCAEGGGATALAPGAVQPSEDRTPGGGTMCFVTGQGTNAIDPENGDLDGGVTTLTSPVLPLSGLQDPSIDFWRWFYSNGDGDDWLATLISNDGGAHWTTVDTLRGTHNHWEEKVIHVASYVAPTSQVKIRLVAADGGYASIVEAAVDDFSAYDAVTTVAAGPDHPPGTLAFRTVWPNPAPGTVHFALEVPRGGPVEVEVLDLAGRRVRTLHRGPAAAGSLGLRWNGEDEVGHVAPAGLYYVRALADQVEAKTRFVRVR
jgi:choice-of-anchor B domain-containing protein